MFWGHQRGRKAFWKVQGTDVIQSFLDFLLSLEVMIIFKQKEKDQTKTPQNHNYYLYEGTKMWFCYNLEILLTSVVRIEDQIGTWFLQVCSGFVTNVFALQRMP